MIWYAISGSWKVTNEEVRKDVEEVARQVIKNGNGIVTGGALGVDYLATEIVLKEGDPKTQLLIILPIPLEKMCAHYHKRAKEGVIKQDQADIITNQLKRVHELAPNSIIDTGYTEASKETYYARNTNIIEKGNELYAFQVNDSPGVQDAIDKAKEMNKPVHMNKYYI